MQDIIMRIVLIIIIGVGGYLIYTQKDKYKLILDNKFWVFISWGFAFILYFFLGIEYTQKLNIFSFGYIILYWFIFVGGQYTFKKYSQNKKVNKEDNEIDLSEKINLFPLFIVSLICVIIYAIYIISINNINIGTTRDIKTNGFATLLLIFSNSSLVIWLYELAYAITNEKKITVYGILSAVIYNIPGVIISGRDALMIFLISTVIIFVYCGNYARKVLKKECRTYKKILKYSAAAFAAIMIYLIFLSNNRYGTDKSAVINMFRWSSKCQFPPYLEWIYYNCGGLGKLILNVVFYYSSQLSKFALIFEKYDGPYMFGLYQLHYVSRLLPESWNMSFTIVTNKIYEITANVGIPGLKVFWDTAIGYSIYDFGRIGTLVMAFIGGFIIEKINEYCNSKKDVLSITTKTFICTAMFLTIEVSPVFDYYYVFPAFWLGLISFLDWKGAKIFGK